MNDDVSRQAALSSREPEIRRWLEDFSAAVRNVDYPAGREMFAEDVLSFGTRNNILIGLEQLERWQWRRVWGGTREFRFDFDTLRCDIDGDLAMVAATWTSEGKRTQDEWFQRSGRATFALRRVGGEWRAVHSHFSLTPADSL